MTKEELQRIEKKIENGEELELHERCEGFSVDEDGNPTDSWLHGTKGWDDDDDFVFELIRSKRPPDWK